jgi:glycosyltransferase involved in cell wall biosynthesis
MHNDGLAARAGATALRVLDGARQHAMLARLYAYVPFAWRFALRRWIHGIAGKPMPPLPFPTTGRSLERDAVHRTGPGANFLGYARGEFGIGQNVRSYARALESVQHPSSIFNFDVGRASRQQDHSMDRYLSDHLDYACNVFFINADQLLVARHVLGRNAFAGRRNVGFWVWELERFPRDWRPAFRLVDEVWCPTEFVRNAIAAATDKPVLRMPKSIEFDVPAGIGRAHFGLPADEFLFLFSFDFNSFAARKNPEAVIAAFRRAFADGTNGVRLLIKSTNGGRSETWLEVLRRAVADDPRIEVRDAFLTREEMFGLQNVADCYVSLHRSEGFGLGLAESMYMGKPVIATRYSGNLDFMSDDNSLLVDYTMIPLRNGDYPDWRGQRWADADVGHAAQLMRRVFDDRSFARDIGAKAAASIRRTNSKAACGAAIGSRLLEIDRHRQADKRASGLAGKRHGGF